MILFLEAANNGNQNPWLVFSQLLIPMLIFGVIIYFFLIRPERNRQKQVALMQNSIKKNDKIITIGGLYGIVDEIHEDENAIKIIVASGARIKIERSAVKTVLNRTIEETEEKATDVEVEKKK